MEAETYNTREESRDEDRILVAGTLDGAVHALDASTGTRLWTFPTGDPLGCADVPTRARYPAWRANAGSSLPWMREQAGTAIIRERGGRGQVVQRLSLNARQLVERTPCLTPGGGSSPLSTGTTSATACALLVHRCMAATTCDRSSRHFGTSCAELARAAKSLAGGQQTKTFGWGLWCT